MSSSQPQVVDYDPPDWAFEAGRDAVTASPGWASIAGKSGLLLGFLLVCGLSATRAFRTYQRAV